MNLWRVPTTLRVYTVHPFPARNGRILAMHYFLGHEWLVIHLSLSVTDTHIGRRLACNRVT